MRIITGKNIITELRFKGDLSEIKEIIRKLQTEERRGGEIDLKRKAREFITQAFGTEDIEKLDDTQAIFTKLDIADILDDFADFCEGVPWEEIAEKNKKRRLARLAKQQRRELY